MLTDGAMKQIKLKNELHDNTFCNSGNCNGNMKGESYQRFVLKPNKYIFCVLFQFKESINLKEVDFLMRIGSTSECKFEKLKKENECCLRGLE